MICSIALSVSAAGWMTMDESAGGIGEALGAALAAMLHALLLLVLFALTLLARALQALFILARPALLAGSAALACYGAVELFQSLVARYGGNLDSVVLSLALVATVPTALLLLSGGKAGVWPVLLASGVLALMARICVDRAPVMVLGFIPCAGLVACVLYFAFGQEGNDNEQEVCGQ